MGEKRSFVLPVSIVSPTDVARLLREIESIDTYFRQSTIRKAGTQDALPRMSKLMDQLTADNQLNLLQEEHRKYVADSLEILHASAPVLHVSFSTDPPGSYVQKIVSWLRKNIHAQVLVTVGLQPNIGAGCVVRTTNKIFDFSLREYFEEKRSFFIDRMHEAITDQPAPEGEPTTTEVEAAEVEAVEAEAPVQPQQPAEQPAEAQEVAQ